MSGLAAVRDGAVAGTFATLAMSALMWAAGKAGLMGEQPPQRISRRMLAAVGRRHPSKVEEEVLAAANHVAFGAVAGGTFEGLRRALPRRPPAIPAGIVWGLVVWLVSYAGWLPALRIMAPPDKDRPGRQASLVAAHVVYGAVLGACCGRRAPKPGIRHA